VEEFGHKFPFPHAKYIGADIFETRFRGQEGHIRVLYFFYDQDKVIFTNGFIKKTGKTPKNEIEKAIERGNKYLNKAKGDD
jgi:phage-related protein